MISDCSSAATPDTLHDESIPFIYIVNQSLKSYVNTVITARNGQLDPDDEYVLNPSFADMPNSDLDMVVAGTESAVLMV